MATAQPDVSAVAPPVSAAAAAPPKGKSSARRFVLFGVLAVVAVSGTLYYLHSRHYEDTDDAQIDGSLATISPRVAGTIKTLYVTDNQVVKAGDLLAEIDTADLEVAVDEAKAQVAQAEAQLRAEDPTVPMAEVTNEAAISSSISDMASAQAAYSGAQKDVDTLTAQLTQAEANDHEAEQEKARSEKLFADGSVSRAELDARINAAAATSAAADALRQSLASAKDRVSQAAARIASASSHYKEVKTNAPKQVETRKASVLMRRANLDLANAQLAQAELNLSYAKILAPVAGIVGKKSVAVGDHVAPGQELMAISQIDGLYVTANFRETQLERMREGQHADIHVDALSLDLSGSVESLGGATGSRFSVLPPENASGNYVKVVQRLPVRIRIDPGQAGTDRLRMGMSVEPKVTVR